MVRVIVADVSSSVTTPPSGRRHTSTESTENHSSDHDDIVVRLHEVNAWLLCWPLTFCWSLSLREWKTSEDVSPVPTYYAAVHLATHFTDLLN